MDAAAPPVVPVTLTATSAVVGSTMTLRVSPLPPGVTATFAAGGNLVAPGACPPAIAPTCIALAPGFVIIGTAVADGSGSATLALVVPPNAPPQIELQAFASGGGRVALSNPLVRTRLTGAGDADGDGVSNANEVSAGTNPENAAPTLTSCAISPAAPYDHQDLVAVASANDAEGDPITYQYAFAVGGVQVTDYAPSNTLPAYLTSVGESWSALCMATSGNESREAASSSVSISPSVDTCSGNPQWVPVDCVTDVWAWSSDRAYTTLAAASAAEELFAGCIHASIPSTCGPDLGAFVSVDTLVMSGCDTDWMHIGLAAFGFQAFECGGHDGDVVRRLAPTAFDCYAY